MSSTGPAQERWRGSGISMKKDEQFPVAPGHQAAFGVLNLLRSKAGQGRLLQRILAKGVLRVLSPVTSRILQNRSFVTARLYGYPLTMRMDHRLPEILAYVPTFNEPLGLLAETLAGNGRRISVIDVGANIGDTVALIERSCPRQAQYLCIEPDEEFSRLCTFNLRTIPRVLVVSEIIGDRADAEVTLVEHRPGTAATRIMARGVQPNENTRGVARLDSVAWSFAAEFGLDLIKCDTDGFDFPVLRSAEALLDTYHPAILFEWHPDLWIKAGEDPAAIFDYLFGRGYKNLVFFTNEGRFFCTTGLRDVRLLEGLRDLCLARHGIDDLHFDVLAADESVCRTVVERSLSSYRKPSR